MRKNRDEDEPTAERVCFAGGAANGTEENIDLLCNLLPRKSIWQHRKKQIEFHSRKQPSEFQSKFLNFKFDDSAQYKKMPIFDWCELVPSFIDFLPFSLVSSEQKDWGKSNSSHACPCPEWSKAEHCPQIVRYFSHFYCYIEDMSERGFSSYTFPHEWMSHAVQNHHHQRPTLLLALFSQHFSFFYQVLLLIIYLIFPWFHFSFDFSRFSFG